MEKISKILPPSRRTQYLDLTKKNNAREEAAKTDNADSLQQQSGRVSRFNAQKIGTLLEAEKNAPGKAKAFDDNSESLPLKNNEISTLSNKVAEFNSSADTAPEILENLVVDKNSNPVDRVSIARSAKEASEAKAAFENESKEEKAPMDVKKASYESLKEAKGLQAAREIARKFQATKENVDSRKEIRGQKTQSEAAAERLEKQGEAISRS